MLKSAPDREDLIAAYVRHARAGPQDEADFWAWQKVTDTINDGPAEPAWSLVLDLVRAVPDDVLGNVAAGPLEDVVCIHGVELIDRIEVSARRDPRFREALGQIWLEWGELPDDVISRVVAASNDQIKPLPRDPRRGPPRA